MNAPIAYSHVLFIVGKKKVSVIDICLAKSKIKIPFSSSCFIKSKFIPLIIQCN